MADPDDIPKGELVLAPGALPPDVLRAELEHLTELTAAIEDEALAPATRKAYQLVWVRFRLWCAQRGLESLPVESEVLKLYITAATSEGVPRANGQPGKPIRMQAVWSHLSAIAFAHKYFGHSNPIDRLSPKYLKGLQRALPRSTQKKTWLSMSQLNAAVSGLPRTLKGLRDRAALLVAFASGGRRRSEVAGMQFEELQRTDDGWLWRIPRTKTSDTVFEVAIPQLRGDPELCPARALAAWMSAANISSGPVFRRVDRHGHIGEKPMQGRVVADIVKDAVRRMGLDPKDFGGHSLRSGFITHMARKKVGIAEIMARSGHKTHSVAQGYIQAATMMGRSDPVIRALEADEEEE